MSDEFTRNIKNIRDIDKQTLDTNDWCDLLIDKENNAYIRRFTTYHNLVDNIKTINGVKADLESDTNDFTLKTDWNETKSTSPNFIHNKPFSTIDLNDFYVDNHVLQISQTLKDEIQQAYDKVSSYEEIIIELQETISRLNGDVEDLDTRLQKLEG